LARLEVWLRELFGPEGEARGADSFDVLGEAIRRVAAAHARSQTRPFRDSILDEAQGRRLIASLSKSALNIADRCDAAMPKMLRRSRREVSAFRRRLARTWGLGLDRLDALYDAQMEIGSHFLESERRGESRPGPKLVALSRVHVRSCRVVAEICWLLRGGFADGAHARWRTLHELAVVALLLAQNDDELATRYLDHRAIQVLANARQLERHAEALNWEAPTEAEMATMVAERNRLVNLYGPAFESQYGWAAALLSKYRPTFADVEERARLAKWRPIFGWASHGVHGGAQGFVALGAIEDRSHLLLAGVSNRGLLEPAQNTIIAMEHLTAALMLAQPTAENLVLVTGFIELATRCRDAFVEAHDVVEARTAALRTESKTDTSVPPHESA